MKLALALATFLLVFTTAAAPAQTLTRRTMTFGGQTRVWFEAVPTALPAGKPAPMVLALHGFNNRGDSFGPDSEWPAVAAATGAFFAVFPNAGEPIGTDGNFAWHDFYFDGSAPDDTGFLFALVNQLVAEGRADPNRIFLTGFSDGGAMALQFLCAHPEIPAAYSPWSGSWFSSFYPEFDVPMSRLNPIVPLPVWVWGNDNETIQDGSELLTQEVRDQVQYFVGVFGHAPFPDRTETDGPRTTQVWAGGKAEVRFTLYANSGHSLHPGTAAKVWNELFSHVARGTGGPGDPPTFCVVSPTAAGLTASAP